MAEVEVWYLRAPNWQASQYLTLVSDDERSRAQRFRRPSDAGRFLASRALARVVLARRLDLSPAELVFDRHCRRCGDPDHGRPSLHHVPHRSEGRSGPGRGTPSTVEFSLSRAGTIVAMAVASSPIGLDAEPDGAGTEDLVDSSVFSEADQAWIRGAPAGSQSERLLTCWVAREAIGKASGLGLVDAGGIVSPPPGEGWLPAADASGGPCWLAWLTLPDAAAAVAIYDRPSSLSVRDAGDLGLPPRSPVSRLRL